MERTKTVDQGRGRLWIVVGLSLAALSAIVFALIVTARPGGSSVSPSTQSSTPEDSFGPGAPALETSMPMTGAPDRNGLLTPPEEPPSTVTAQPPSSVTAQPPSTVTVTVTVTAPPAATAQQPVPAAAAAQPTPSAAAPSGGGLLNSTAATIGAVTTLMIAITGLITAATGLAKILRPRASTPSAPPQ